MPEPLFDKIALVGIGLIGSSLARVVRREGLAGHIAIATRSDDDAGARRGTRPRRQLHDRCGAKRCSDADLVIVSVPVGSSGAVAERSRRR